MNIEFCIVRAFRSIYPTGPRSEEGHVVLASANGRGLEIIGFQHWLYSPENQDGLATIISDYIKRFNDEGITIKFRNYDCSNEPNSMHYFDKTDKKITAYQLVANPDFRQDFPFFNKRDTLTKVLDLILKD